MFTIKDDTQVSTNINYITRKNNKWVSDNEVLDMISDIHSFLYLNPQFVKISPFVILNLDSIEGNVLDGTDAFLIVSGIKFEIKRRYISNVRAAYKKFVNKKYAKTDTIKKSKWISKVRSSSERLHEVNIENIKYLERKGTLTTIHYNDGSVRSFYETLKYFEKIFDKNSFLVRIRRNCIINMRFVVNYKADSSTKTAKIDIDSQELHISRRKLPEFKRRRKAI